MSPFFALACGRTFSSQRIALTVDVIGPENILFAGESLHLSARKFYRLGSEGVNLAETILKKNWLRLK